jgi:hypothetical protein
VSRPSGYKPYNPELDRYGWLEGLVIERTSPHLQNHVIVKNPDEKGIDLLIKKDDQVVGGIEVEWHGTYWKKRFPFNTVHFLGRKTKFIGDNRFYLMSNDDGSQVLAVGFDELKHHETQIQDNRLAVNEPIYDVPNDHCIWGWDDFVYIISNHFEPGGGYKID